MSNFCRHTCQVWHTICTIQYMKLRQRVKIKHCSLRQVSQPVTLLILLSRNHAATVINNTSINSLLTCLLQEITSCLRVYSNVIILSAVLPCSCWVVLIKVSKTLYFCQLFNILTVLLVRKFICQFWDRYWQIFVRKLKNPQHQCWNWLSISKRVNFDAATGKVFHGSSSQQITIASAGDHCWDERSTTSWTADRSDRRWCRR